MGSTMIKSADPIIENPIGIKFFRRQLSLMERVGEVEGLNRSELVRTAVDRYLEELLNSSKEVSA